MYDVYLFLNSFTAEQISKLRASQSPIAISVQRCPTWSSLDPLVFRRYWDNDSNGVLLNTGQTGILKVSSLLLWFLQQFEKKRVILTYYVQCQMLLKSLLMCIYKVCNCC